MNRIAPAALALITAVTVAACGGGNSPTGPDPVSVTPSTTVAPRGSGASTFTTLDHDNDEGEPAITANEDESYIDTEAQFHEAAIRMSEIADRAGDNPRVKFLAQQTAQNHRGWLADLRSLAPGHVATAIELTPEQDDSIDAVLEERGSALDRRYVEQLIDHYQDAIPVLQAFATGGSTSELQQHVLNNLLQNFNRQLAMARDTAGFVGANREGAE